MTEERAESFEQALRRVDEILGSLERGDIELDAALALFEEGMERIRVAEARLNDARGRVEQLVGDEGQGSQPTAGDGRLPF